MLKPLRHHGFTLVELLVVVAIIVVLMSILLPSLQKARESARTAVCGSNERQLYMASVFFMQDRDGKMPGAGYNKGKGWGQIIGFTVEEHTKIVKKNDQRSSLIRLGYLPGDKVFRCPEALVQPATLKEAVAKYGWDSSYHYGVAYQTCGNMYYGAFVNVSDNDPLKYTAAYKSSSDEFEEALNYKIQNAVAPHYSVYIADRLGCWDYLDRVGAIAGNNTYVYVSPMHNKNTFSSVCYLDGHVEIVRVSYSNPGAIGKTSIPMVDPF